MTKAKTTEAPKVAPEGTEIVDNTATTQRAPAKAVATEEYELVDGLTQVNYV